MVWSISGSTSRCHIAMSLCLYVISCHNWPCYNDALLYGTTVVTLRLSDVRFRTFLIEINFMNNIMWNTGLFINTVNWTYKFSGVTHITWALLLPTEGTDVLKQNVLHIRTHWLFNVVAHVWLLSDCPVDPVVRGGGSLEALSFSSSGPCTWPFWALCRVRVDIVLPSQIQDSSSWPPWETQPCGSL